MKFPAIVGKKRGMTRLFSEDGAIIVCTVVQVMPNVVTATKTVESDGYSAIQIAANPRKETKVKSVKKPQREFFSKISVSPHKTLYEARVPDSSKYSIGTVVGTDQFEIDAFVDASSISKGKGFQGVIKRHGFAGGPASHGSSKFHRKAGSTGSRSTPGRVFPGHKMPGRMGGEMVTVQNIKVVAVEGDMVLLAGSIPGVRGSDVKLRPATKKNGGN